MPLGCPRRARPLLALTLLAACASRSEVVELSPELFALTQKGSTPAAAARLGVENARAHCTALGHGFEPVRTLVGYSEYQIAFRCPRPVPAEMPLGADEALTPPSAGANSGLPNPFRR
jgi:hypothetical protein